MRLFVVLALLSSATQALAEDVVMDTVGQVSFNNTGKLLIEGKQGDQTLSVNKLVFGNLANNTSIELKRSCEAAAKAVMIRPEKWDIKISSITTSDSFITACTLIVHN